VQLPLQGSSQETVVVESELPGVVGLSVDHSKSSSPLLGSVVVSEVSTHGVGASHIVEIVVEHVGPLLVLSSIPLKSPDEVSVLWLNSNTGSVVSLSTGEVLWLEAGMESEEVWRMVVQNAEGSSWSSLSSDVEHDLVVTVLPVGSDGLSTWLTALDGSVPVESKLLKSIDILQIAKS